MSDEPSFNDDFLDLLHVLNEEGVEFLVVGAHALAAHGVVRASGDLDVLVRPTRDNALLVVRALRKFGAPLEQHGVGADDFEQEGTVYQLGLPPRRIDLLTKVSGLTFDEAATGDQEVGIAGVTFRVPSAEALLVNKRSSGRDKDLDDVRRLEAVLRAKKPEG